MKPKLSVMPIGVWPPSLDESGLVNLGVNFPLFFFFFSSLSLLVDFRYTVGKVGRVRER